MREFLRLAALLVLWGVMLVVASLLSGLLGFAVTDIQDAATAHKAAGGNAFVLLVTFGGAAYLYFALLGRAEGWKLLRGVGADRATYGWIALFMAGLFLVLPWLGLDEESFRLPPSLHKVEVALEAQEARVEEIMQKLITHGSLPLLLLFMAVAPGFCEEFFFRGAFQYQLRRLMNPHLAVWLTGLIFSLVHLQVYGLVPRWLLGVVMGYLTLWSGRLWPAAWAHFLNNAYATIVAYAGVHWLGHPEWIASTYRPPFVLAIVGAAIAGAAGFQVYKKLRG